MINNKGFTLIEYLITIVVISFVLFVVVKEIGRTLSITKNEAYSIMKQNITNTAKDYLNECNNNIINCNLNWNKNKTSFKAKILMESNYFKNLNSPIDGKDLSNCLIITAIKDNGVITTKLEDNCY